MKTNLDLTTEQRWPRDCFPVGSLIWDFPGGQLPDTKASEEEEDTHED